MNEVKTDENILFKYDSPEDLYLRGFGRLYIKKHLDFEIGTGNSPFKDKLSNVDRLEYRVNHLIWRVPAELIEKQIKLYESNIDFDLEQLMNSLGLSQGNNKQFVSSKKNL